MKEKQEHLWSLLMLTASLERRQHSHNSLRQKKANGPTAQTDTSTKCGVGGIFHLLRRYSSRYWID
jgi:hypothetical protein